MTAVLLHCNACDRDLPLRAFSRDNSAPSRFYRMWTCQECKTAGRKSGRGNGMEVRKINMDRLSEVKQAIEELAAAGEPLTSRGVARHLGRDDSAVRRDWDLLAAEGEAPPRPRAGPAPLPSSVSSARQAQLDRERVRHDKRRAARQAADRAEIEDWRGAHEAIGGAVATAASPQVKDARDKIIAAITRCIVEVSRALQDPGFSQGLADAESNLVSDDFRLSTAAQRLTGLLEKIPDTRHLGTAASGAPAKWRDPELLAAVRVRVLADTPLTGLAIQFGVAPGTVERAAIYAKGLIAAEQEERTAQDPVT